MQDEAPRNSSSPAAVRLTPAESRVLGLLSTHLTLAAIGDRLGSSRSTVKTHVAHIYAKLAVTSRGAAVERARELGLLRGANSTRTRAEPT
ncbi:MAG: LuxR C-terminal-related transcriptional regulator [Gaiella sp.]|nr:LuxR C-terminal-related transcriptional regulator [Gaiella sp.]